MQDIIDIKQSIIGSGLVHTVNARDLHVFLEVGRDFSNWIKDRIDEYGFLENQDFVCSPNLASKGRGGHNRIDYHLTLDMAQELGMVERNDKGREIRRYFIACRKRLLDQGIVDAAIAAVLLPSPLPWEKRFHDGYYQALAKLTNTRYLGHAGGTPALWGQITQEWVYRSLMPAEVYAALRDRCGDTNRLHQWLTDGGRERLQARIEAVTMMANSSANLPDFKARCQRAFGTPGQLRIVYPLAA